MGNNIGQSTIFCCRNKRQNFDNFLEGGQGYDSQAESYFDYSGDQSGEYDDIERGGL